MLFRSREAQVAIIAEKYGLNSEEGHGVMGVFIVGTVLGALWTSIFTSVIVNLNLFNPLALGLAAGNSSLSMSTAALEVISSHYTDSTLIEKVTGYMNTSNLLVNILAVYVNMLITLPVTSWLYEKLNKFSKVK